MLVVPQTSCAAGWSLGHGCESNGPCHHPISSSHSCQIETNSRVLVHFSAHWVDSEWLSIHLHENIWSPAPDRDQTPGAARKPRSRDPHALCARRTSSGMHRTCRWPREKGVWKVWWHSPLRLFEMNTHLVFLFMFCTLINVRACVVQYNAYNVMQFDFMMCYPRRYIHRFLQLGDDIPQQHTRTHTHIYINIYMCVCVRVYSCACNFCLEVNVEVRIGLLNQLASQTSFDVLQSEDVKLWVVSTRETMNSFMAAKEWTLRNAMPQCFLILQSSGCTDVEGHWSCKAPCEVSTFSIVLHHQPKHCFLAGWHWQVGPRLHFPDWLCFLFSCLTLCPDDSINLNLMRKEDAFCMLTFGIRRYCQLAYLQHNCHNSPSEWGRLHLCCTRQRHGQYKLRHHRLCSSLRSIARLEADTLLPSERVGEGAAWAASATQVKWNWTDRTPTGKLPKCGG